MFTVCASLLVISSLTACGGSGQDKPAATTVSTSNLNNTDDLANRDRAVEIVSRLDMAIDRLVSTSGENASFNEVTGSVRALETVIMKAVNETTTDTSIDNVISFIGDAANTHLVDTLTENLSGDNVDLSTVSKSIGTNDELSTPEKIVELTKIPENITPFSKIGGYSIRIADPDLGTAPNSVNDEEIEFYFSGDATNTSGKFTACAKHIQDANVTTGELGDGNTRGTLVTGNWSLLGAAENKSSYSLILTLKYLGANYQAIMKPAGIEVINNLETQKFRFDNDGRFIVWNSSAGFASNTSIPTTDKECEARLPSRVGLN